MRILELKFALLSFGIVWAFIFFIVIPLFLLFTLCYNIF